MNLQDWNERYRSGERSARADAPPTRLVVEWAGLIPPGAALDLACGSGRNAGCLADLGWHVTAVDGASVAIELLRLHHPRVQGVVADLAAGEFRIEPQQWDLILTAYYLQRDLFPAIKAGVRPGGFVFAIAHLPEPGEEPNYKRVVPGELRGYFTGWEILHYYEGPSRDPLHRRPVAEIVAQKKPAPRMGPAFSEYRRPKAATELRLLPWPPGSNGAL